MVCSRAAIFAAGIAAVLVTCAGVVHASVTISNVTPRRDAAGQILSMSDGRIIRNPDAAASPKWLAYVMTYGLCEEQPTGCANTTFGNCGFRLDHNVTVLGSEDLSMNGWRVLRHAALPVDSRPTGVYFRPHVLWHAETQQFVLWSRWQQPPSIQSPPLYTVSTASTADGPFKTVVRNASLAHVDAADDNLFLDDDGTAYIAYTARSTERRITIDRLTSSFMASAAITDPTATSGPFGPTNVEAPAMFKRQGVYYVTMGSDCCFCARGSDLHVFASRHPLGPYEDLGVIYTPPSSGSIGDHPPHGQQTYVLAVPNNETVTYVFWANRWQSAPDHKKDHDYHYWTPLHFSTVSDGNKSLPAIMPLSWVDEFTLNT